MFIVLALLYLGTTQGKVALPFESFLLQEPAFQVEAVPEDSGSLPAKATVPLVMRILFEEAEHVANNDILPGGGDFQALAQSIRPVRIEELGLQRVVLDFPPLEPESIKARGEAWLVFQLRQSHILGNNCTQVLTVYENNKRKMTPVVTVPLNYKTNDPLLVVNITKSLISWKKGSPSYVVLIKDSTSYTQDQHLYSFANYIDCSLARACEVLELRDINSGPVLLVLSPQLAANKLLAPQRRYRRSADSKEKRSLVDRSCHLKEWNVNIEQLGWDWLVYPERIPLNLCVGTCPVLLDRHFNATSHAVARGVYRLVLGPESKPDNSRPCCVPVKYRRFNMLIEKHPGIISLETSSDLSAAQCGCR